MTLNISEEKTSYLIGIIIGPPKLDLLALVNAQYGHGGKSLTS